MRVLLIGGTGSLGQVLAKKFIELNSINKISIYSRSEHKQEEMRERLKNNEKLRFWIGDIRDKDRLKLALSDGFEYIVNAAALKVVPLGEQNPFEVIKTNVLGVQNLVDCCLELYKRNLQIIKVIQISTDKACRPINLYGAAKLCAEKIIISSNNISGATGPRFSVARYGNVANSNGSVIPLFQRQLVATTQLTITDDRMSRFWITLDEASDFVLRCLGAMYGGEIFVPKMSAFKVKDLAITMMRDAGYPLEKQYCRVIGIRPGEKLYEEIITEEETSKTKYLKDKGVYMITDNINYGLEGADTFEPLERKSINSDNVYTMGQDELSEKVKAVL
jgi:UDP-N-acetylglucosamine 4,6-dehydratase